jgi:hypothetical protein
LPDGLKVHFVGGQLAKCASNSEYIRLSVSSKVQYHPPEKTVKNKFKHDYALLQIPRIYLFRMLSYIPLSAVKNATIPMKHGSFSVGAAL